ncbi:hypothetical protein Lal_00012733 [Lupinus albus]|uniref:Putative EF-hand domain pair protein n=1 Tax=Lupinus albus TaxID=3870 RepID=A0A6A5NQ79_LUPAL|nr:putative EF-hand domain pair protein [Lupinus albus]KAF1883815.1 hypothetical protein Lal_00012733 [Lupinus albus]
MNKLSQYESVFNHFDKNGDDKISPSELRQCVESIDEKLSTEEAEEAIRVLDMDNDGVLGLDDFMRFMEGGNEEEKMNDLREAFKIFEMEGSDCITPMSLKRTLSRLGESRTIDECQIMISSFDVNSDGVLSFDEFKVMML